MCGCGVCWVGWGGVCVWGGVPSGHDIGPLILPHPFLEEISLALQRDQIHPGEGVGRPVQLEEVEKGGYGVNKMIRELTGCVEMHQTNRVGICAVRGYHNSLPLLWSDRAQ